MQQLATAAERWRDATSSGPDYVVYIPTDGDTPEHPAGPVHEYAWDRFNTHFLVTVTTAGTFLANWTQAGDYLHGTDQRVVVARSPDRGRTWSRPTVLDGPDSGAENIASWSFPVIVPHSGRIYSIYHKNPGPVDFDRGMTGVLAWRYSDDDGISWSERYERPIRRAAIDDPDEGMFSSFVTPGWQPPIVNRRGQVLCPITRWAGNAFESRFETVTPEIGFNERHHESWFLRFDNILTETDPSKLSITAWPEGDVGLRIPQPRNELLSTAMEPTIQCLSDGRIVCLMRTMTGFIWYSVSEDHGESWRDPEVLRFTPDGPRVPHPSAPCPLYKMQDGRFLLFFHNNDGTAHGGNGPGSGESRRPIYISVGCEIDNPEGQPLAFGRPHMLVDNNYAKSVLTGRPGGMANYGSFTEYGGERVWWYCDRAQYLLGKRISDEMLDGAWLPS